MTFLPSHAAMRSSMISGPSRTSRRLSCAPMASSWRREVPPCVPTEVRGDRQIQRGCVRSIGMRTRGRQLQESAAAWAQFMPRETQRNAVASRARARVTRGHEFSLWFVELCWIVSICVDGGSRADAPGVWSYGGLAGRWLGVRMFRAWVCLLGVWFYRVVIGLG